jgi:hypothetical protein
MKVRPFCFRMSAVVARRETDDTVPLEAAGGSIKSGITVRKETQGPKRVEVRKWCYG